MNTFALMDAPCSRSVSTTKSMPHWQQRCSGVAKSLASSPPAPLIPGLLGESKSHPARMRKIAADIRFSSVIAKYF
jgi:hypothetical protein